MPQNALISALSAVVGIVRATDRGTDHDPLEDARLIAWDQRLALQQVSAVLSLETRLSRPTVLSAVRHDLRLPLGVDAVPPGRLHLLHADDSSIGIGSMLEGGSMLRCELFVRDHDGGSTADYAVLQWHEQDGAICGLRQLMHLRETIAAAVRALDLDVRITDTAAARSE